MEKINRKAKEKEKIKIIRSLEELLSGVGLDPAKISKEDWDELAEKSYNLIHGESYEGRGKEPPGKENNYQK